jgi:uridine kinase
MKIIVIIGLAASGKSHYAKELNKSFCGVIVDDNLIDNNKDIIINLIEDGRDFIYTDAMLCNPTVFNLFKTFIDSVKDEQGIEEIEYIYFENDPEQCLINAASPTRQYKKVENFIRQISKEYIIPEGVIPLKVYRASEATEERGTLKD